MGFDLWSFVFQTINFVVLVLVLTRLVYRPLRRSIDERNARITDREDAAAALRAEVDKQLEAAKTHDREINDEREELLRETREQAATLRARLVAEAEEDAAAVRERGEHLLAIEREAALESVGELAIEKSVGLASALLGGLSHEVVDEALITMLLTEVGAKLGAGPAPSPGVRHGPPHEVEITFARPPPVGAAARIQGAISTALGEPVGIACHEDPKLVAGVVVRIGHEVWDASVAGQLTAFRERARRELQKEPVVG